MVFLLLKIAVTVVLLSILMLAGVVACYHADNALLAEREEDAVCSG